MRRLFPLVAIASCCAVIVPAVAGAQAKVQGSPLTSPANYAYGCETGWLIGSQPPFDYEPGPYGASTCSLFQPGTTLDNTHLVPGSGTVLSARVKAGTNPPQVSIATVRRFFKPNAQGQVEYTCCQGISETPPVALAPNAITEIPVNFIVLTQQPENGNTGYWDIVTVNVHGPGRLPMSDLGAHSSSAGANVPAAYWYYPKIAPNDSNQNAWSAPNFEVLMQYDWCPKIAATASRATCPSAPPPSSGGGTTTPPTTPPPSGGGTTTPATATPTAKPAGVTSTKLRLSGGRVKLGVSCRQTTTCVGTVRLRTVSGRRLLGSRKIAVVAGERETVALTLSKANRRRVTRKGIKVVAEVDLGTAGRVTRTLTLKR